MAFQLTQQQRTRISAHITNATIVAYDKFSDVEAAIWRVTNRVHDVDVKMRLGWAKCQRCDGSGSSGIANVHYDRGVAGGDDIPHQDHKPCVGCGGLGARWPVRVLQLTWGYLVDMSTSVNGAKCASNRVGIFLARAAQGGPFDAMLDFELGPLKVTLRVPATVVVAKVEGDGEEG